MRVKILIPALVLTAVVLLGGCTGSYNEKSGKTPSQAEIPGEGKIQFKEDFEGYDAGDVPSDKWILMTVAKGSPDEYRIVSLDGNKALLIQLRGYRQITDVLVIKGLNVDNFSMSFRLHESRPYETVPAMVFRFSGGDYYLITYNEYGKEPGAIGLYRVKNGNPDLIAEKVIHVKSLQDGQWHEFGLEVNGSRAVLKMDGLQILSVEGLTLKSGMLGFANSDGSLGRYLVDDVAVMEI